MGKVKPLLTHIIILWILYSQITQNVQNPLLSTCFPFLLSSYTVFIISDCKHVKHLIMTSLGLKIRHISGYTCFVILGRWIIFPTWRWTKSYLLCLCLINLLNSGARGPTSSWGPTSPRKAPRHSSWHYSWHSSWHTTRHASSTLVQFGDDGVAHLL